MICFSSDLYVRLLKMETIKHYNTLWKETKANYSGRLIAISSPEDRRLCCFCIDPRTSHLFMMDSPLPSALICLGYLVVVLMGPRLMANRPAFKIREILIIYNFSMVILSGYLFYEVNLSSDGKKANYILSNSILVSRRWLVKWLFVRLSTCRLFSFTKCNEGKTFFFLPIFLSLISLSLFPRRWFECVIYFFSQNSSNYSTRSFSL